MKKLTAPLLAVCWLLLSCNNTTPREYFEQAALNVNTVYGFADYEIKREMATPSERLVDEKTMKTEPMKRTEVVKEKITRVEENYQKVKSLGSNPEADEMLKASLALYEYVLPVYKNEYVQLATLYDENAPAEKIATLEKQIIDKYVPRFQELYDNVVKTGTAYAEKNGIEVRQVNPSPKL